MSYSKTDLLRLKDFYQNQLVNDTVPFWFPRSIDTEFGGYLLMRDHDGSLIDDDKAVWIQGRAAWLLSTLYNTIEPKQEWLDGAKSGIDFLNNHCFDTDGQMFFHVTREGQPIRNVVIIFRKPLQLLRCQLTRKQVAMKLLLKKRVFYSGNALNTPLHQVYYNLNSPLPDRQKELEHQ